MGAGGGGGAVPPAGLSPLQRANFDVSQGQAKYAMGDVRRYGMQMRDLATGGLMGRGLQQMNRVLNAPSLAPGMQARTAARYGMVASPEQQQAMANQLAMSQASTEVALRNNTRNGLTNAMRDMRFGGLGV